MEENNIEQDVFLTHGYKSGQEILINAEFLLGVLALNRIIPYIKITIAITIKYTFFSGLACSYKATPMAIAIIRIINFFISKNFKLQK